MLFTDADADATTPGIAPPGYHGLTQASFCNNAQNRRYTQTKPRAKPV